MKCSTFDTISSYFPHQHSFHQRTKNDAYELKYEQTVCNAYSKLAVTVVNVALTGNAASVVAKCVHKTGEGHVKLVAVLATVIYFVYTAGVAVAPTVI